MPTRPPVMLLFLASASLTGIMACQFHMSSNLGGSASSAPSSSEPEPASASAEPDCARSKAGCGESRSTADDYDTLQVNGDSEPAPTGPMASAIWDGSYAGTKDGCPAGPRFDPRKGDDQTSTVAELRDNDVGFMCPGSCGNPEPAKLVHGKLSFSLVWVDDHPAKVGAGYAVAMHRQRYQLDLVKDPSQFGDGVDGVAARQLVEIGSHEWLAYGHPYISTQMRIAANLLVLSDPHLGYGRGGMLDVRVGTKGKFTEQSVGGSCTQLLFRGDFKQGDGKFDSDGDDDEDDGGGGGGGGGGGNRDADRQAKAAQRRCKSDCMSEGGECRKACHGSSAKCASDCNHSEKSCKSSC